jgi:hypothetical protein
MEDLINKLSSVTKATSIRLPIILFLAILLYVFKFSIIWLIVVVAINGYLTDTKNEAIISGAILGYFIHLAIIISNVITFHQAKSVGIKLLIFPLAGAIAGVVLSRLSYTIKQGNVIWMLILGIVAAGFPLWITSYHQFTNSIAPMLMSLILLAIVTGVATVQTELKAGSLLFVMMTAFLIALFIKFYIDFLEDSSSHNLLPFELIAELVLGLVFTAIGLACGLAFKKKYSEDELL